MKNAKNDSGLCLLSALPAKTGQTLNRLPTQDFSALAGYMSTFRNRNLEKISLVSTFENENLKIIFFVSTFLDWYKQSRKNRKNVILGIGFTQKNVQTIL